MKKIFLVLSLLFCSIGLAGCGDNKISEQRAQEIALQDAGVDPADTISLSVGFEDKNELDAHYDVVFQTHDKQYDYDINARSGAIMSKEVEPIVDANGNADNNQPAPNNGGNNQPQITAEEAKNIALKDAGLTADQVRFERTELDSDDGYTVYEIEFTYENSEYDYEVDANTGNIVGKGSESIFD